MYFIILLYFYLECCKQPYSLLWWGVKGITYPCTIRMCLCMYVCISLLVHVGWVPVTVCWACKSSCNRKMLVSCCCLLITLLAILFACSMYFLFCHIFSKTFFLFYFRATPHGGRGSLNSCVGVCRNCTICVCSQYMHPMQTMQVMMVGKQTTKRTRTTHCKGQTKPIRSRKFSFRLEREVHLTNYREADNYM